MGCASAPRQLPPIDRSTGDPLEPVLALFAAQRSGHMAFTEIRQMAFVPQPDNSSGELFYRAPDYLEMRTLMPDPRTVILDGGLITVRRGEGTHNLELAAFPEAAPFIESLRATLAGDRTALERHFRLSFSGTPEHWQLILTPKDPAMAHAVRRIEMVGTSAMIHLVTMPVPNGDLFIVRIGPELP
jgi:hypothetical protein